VEAKPPASINACNLILFIPLLDLDLGTTVTRDDLYMEIKYCESIIRLVLKRL
jgi:hypothetical protein